MEEAVILQDLTQIFRDIFRREDILLTPETTAGDVEGWDSFKQIDIMMSVEQHYGIKFRTRELENLLNVGDLARAIMTKRSVT